LTRFFISVLALGAIMVVIARSGESTPSWDIGIVTFLAATTSLIYILLNPKREEPERFTQLYLLSIVVKITLSAAFAVLFLKLAPEGTMANTVFFLVAYLLYTGLEVIFLLLKSKAKKIS
jgi:hypothetical protein